MLEIGDKTHYKKMRGRTIDSVSRFSETQWDCIMRGGKLLQIRFKTGILGMSVAEREHDLGEEVMLVGIDKYWKSFEDSIDHIDGSSSKVDSILNKVLNKKRKPNNLRTEISFTEIAEFMEWNCKEENIWDVWLK
tara:strand:+ start:2307 stop:2711 length:405 start_codon:yes stop_codon:yes gene_type:complete